MGFCKLVRLVFCICLISHGISGLNSKLDFGDDSKPSLTNSKQRSIPFKFDQVQTSLKQSDSLDNIGVVCTSTGCDRPKSESGTQNVKTDVDVVVQVKSTVDITNKTKQAEEVPDIPIVLGTKDAGKENKYHGVERGLHFQPVSRTYQENNVQLTPVNIGDVFSSLGALQPANLYDVQRKNGVEVQMKPIVGVISVPDGYKYRTDGLEIKVPYFEPTYHKHYYGENSPPQYAYYPQKKAVRNPVAFNNIVRPTYSLPGWKQISTNQNRRHDENCICHNQSTPGLGWYPSASSQVAVTSNGQRRSQVLSNNFGMHIDDKLASIN